MVKTRNECTIILEIFTAKYGDLRALMDNTALMYASRNMALAAHNFYKYNIFFFALPMKKTSSAIS
jgi:hypothetical protein